MFLAIIASSASNMPVPCAAPSATSLPPGNSHVVARRCIQQQCHCATRRPMRSGLCFAGSLVQAFIMPYTRSLMLQLSFVVLLLSSFAAASTPCDHTHQPPRYLCCSGHAWYALNRYDNCCGAQAYKTEDKICCQGDVLVDRPPGGNDCCDTPTGMKGYNRNSYICCDGNLTYKYWNDSCCIGTAYRSLTHKCCRGGVVVPKDEQC